MAYSVDKDFKINAFLQGMVFTTPFNEESSIPGRYLKENHEQPWEEKYI